MRISSNFGFLIFSTNLRKQQDDMARVYEQVSTGKRVNRPSDDPIAARRIMASREDIANIEQYQRNGTRLGNQLKMTESTLQNVTDLLHTLKEKAIAACNGTLTPEARGHIADEIHQLGLTLETLSNTEFEGKYLFSGFKTDTKPFALAAGYPSADPAATYSGDDSVMQVEVGPGSVMEWNIPGRAVFQGDGTPATADLFQIFADTEAAVRAGLVKTTDVNGVPDQLNKIKLGEDQISSYVSLAGARANRLDSLTGTLEQNGITLQDFVESLEAIDPAQSITDMKRVQTAYQALIGSASQILQLPSLLNFLK